MQDNTQWGYFDTDTWEFIPVEHMEAGKIYCLNTPEHLEQARLKHEWNNKILNFLLWGKG